MLPISFRLDWISSPIISRCDLGAVSEAGGTSMAGVSTECSFSGTVRSEEISRQSEVPRTDLLRDWHHGRTTRRVALDVLTSLLTLRFRQNSLLRTSSHCTRGEFSRDPLSLVTSAILMNSCHSCFSVFPVVLSFLFRFFVLCENSSSICAPKYLLRGCTYTSSLTS